MKISNANNNIRHYSHEGILVGAIKLIAKVATYPLVVLTIPFAALASRIIGNQKLLNFTTWAENFAALNFLCGPQKSTIPTEDSPPLMQNIDERYETYNERQNTHIEIEQFRNMQSADFRLPDAGEISVEILADDVEKTLEQEPEAPISTEVHENFSILAQEMPKPRPPDAEVTISNNDVQQIICHYAMPSRPELQEVKISEADCSNLPEMCIGPESEKCSELISETCVELELETASKLELEICSELKSEAHGGLDMERCMELRPEVRDKSELETLDEPKLETLDEPSPEVCENPELKAFDEPKAKVCDAPKSEACDESDLGKRIELDSEIRNDSELEMAGKSEQEVFSELELGLEQEIFDEFEPEVFDEPDPEVLDELEPQVETTQQVISADLFSTDDDWELREKLIPRDLFEAHPK
ncbi:MAG: hypothetical protein LBI34_04015 [Puniceicoccales bacterium]|jgi:hypothetical protein|nr:hypothetical protein [Puniceicoccales bacterium]